MALIHKETPYEIKRRQRGIKVWAIQRALNTLDYGNLVEDDIFGKQTETAVLAYQMAKVLPQDGVFGPRTSAAVAAALTALVTGQYPGLPPGLLRGIVEGESGNLIAAVNWTVAGGVDCGYCQRRVLEASYENRLTVERAFDGGYQISLLAKTLKSRHDAFYGRRGADSHEKAWRLATLNHNYPSAAENIANNGIAGLSSYYYAPQSWVEDIGAEFPDGYPVRTPLEWCMHYALGDPAHQEPGAMTKYAYGVN